MVNPVSGAGGASGPQPGGNDQIPLQQVTQNLEQFLSQVKPNPDLANYGTGDMAITKNHKGVPNQESKLQEVEVQQLNFAIQFLNSLSPSFGLKEIPAQAGYGTESPKKVQSQIDQAYNAVQSALGQSISGNISQAQLTNLGNSWIQQGVSYYNNTQPNKMAYVTGMAEPMSESTNDLSAVQIGLGAVATGNASLVNQVETYFANPTQANMQAIINAV